MSVDSGRSRRCCPSSQPGRHTADEAPHTSTSLRTGSSRHLLGTDRASDSSSTILQYDDGIYHILYATGNMGRLYGFGDLE